MLEELTLPVIAAAVLLWCLVCAVRQWRTAPSAEPTLIWREKGVGGWSEWRELKTLAPSAEYATVLTAVRTNASPAATAVQFASVVHPAGAPDYTLRVLYVSAAREPRRDHTLAMTK
jgi:hypothetical protein